MAIIVSFAKLVGLGSINAPSIGAVRVAEVVALAGTTVASVQDGEVAVIANGSADMVLIAFGTTPDAHALVATAVSSAFVGIPAGTVIGIPVPAGSKIAVDDTDI